MLANKTSEEDVPESLRLDSTANESLPGVCALLCCILVIFSLALIIVASQQIYSSKNHVPEIKIISMDFAAELDDKNKTTTQQQSHYLHDLVSVRWDLLIRVPGELVGDYMCLQGNLQVSFLYKNVPLVTSSEQSYNKLEFGKPQLLTVSAIASKEDLGSAIGKEIMEAINEKSDVQFRSQLSLTDCREETEKGKMSYECEKAKLRFELDSGQIKATTFGNHPTCIINL